MLPSTGTCSPHSPVSDLKLISPEKGNIKSKKQISRIYKLITSCNCKLSTNDEILLISAA